MYSASAPPFEAAQPTIDVPAEEAPEVSAGGWGESSPAEAPGAPWSEPAAPGDWQPETAPPPADDSEAYPSFDTQESQPVNFDVVEGAPAEGPEPVEAEPEVATAQGLGAIPSDLIDEVVRRTVERMSDDVIREIAWEVVPDLAEALIKKHLAGRA